MSSRRCVSLKGVADILGVSIDWMHRHVRELRDKHGFPQPLPVLRRYDPIAIEAWLDCQRRAAAVAAEVEPDDWAARLDARAKGFVKAKS